MLLKQRFQPCREFMSKQFRYKCDEIVFQLGSAMVFRSALRWYFVRLWDGISFGFKIVFRSSLRWYFVRLWDGISLSAFALRDSIQNRLQSKINVCCEGKIIASWHFVRFSINSQKEKTERQSFSGGGKLLLTGTLWLDFSRAWTATSHSLKKHKKYWLQV